MDIKPYFDIEIKSIEVFTRNDENTVMNLILTSQEDQKYFLKEIQSHSMREGLDELYQELNSTKSKLANYILPLARHDDSSKFLFEKDRRKFLLFHYVQYLPFSGNSLTLNQLWNALDEFHLLISNKKFIKQDYRTYKSWLELGSNRLKTNFGEDLPFLKQIDEFIKLRFEKIQFLTGPIHWDIHTDNLGITSEGKLVILDFDLVQEGTYAQELIASAAVYVDWSNPYNENFMDALWLKVSPLAQGLNKEDLRFLLARNVLGDLALENSKARVIQQLKILEIL